MELEVIDLEAERKQIIREYRKLRREVTPYLKEGDASLIKKAFEVSVEAHKDMRRKSGEPYIFHPIAVAQIVVEEIKLGPTAIIAALLHDVVEDTDRTLDDIEREFGTKVAKIVDGVTKIKTTKEVDWSVSQQAENFRKMVLTLSDDVRVILVKLADRLHNMRTLGSMERHKQLKIASETIYIYAPLAHRLGLYKIKSELEDLYLKYSNRETYTDIARKLDKSKALRNRFIKDFITPIEEAIIQAGFKVRIFGRPKSIFSIFNKMQTQGVAFEGIYDLFAIRIIIDSEGENEKADCWRVYSIVTDFYKPNPDRLRDWISTPRLNGYESLHTTVMGPEGKWVEVQIRTKRMDEIAELGYAAHWKYKEKGKSANTKAMRESGVDIWLRTIRELQQQNEELSATEFINAFRANFYKEEVFVFTPKGDLIKLPIGATVLDFAFEIHTEIGMKCLGAKVNQKLVPLGYELHNGDQIEIITSKQAKPNADWLRFVKSAKAKDKVKQYLREEKKQVIQEGKTALEKKFKQTKIEWSDTHLIQFRLFLSYKNMADLYYDYGKGYVQSKQVNKFHNWLRRKENAAEQAKALSKNGVADTHTEKIPKVDTLILGDSSQLKYTLAKCCNPIPGNDVFGFITINEGIKVHRTDCPNAVELMSNYGYRIIKTIWHSQKEMLFLVGLRILGSDRIGLVRDVTQVISSDMKVNIASIDIGLTQTGIFEGNIKLYVRDQEHLDLLAEKLRKIEGVVSVTRFDSETGEDMPDKI
jgi:GTP pyrophosphokinase